jgi:adhesin transport system outer membrane protein
MTEYELLKKMEEANLSLSKTNFLPDLEIEAYYEELKDTPINENQQNTQKYGRTKEGIKLTQSVYDGGAKYYSLKEAEANVASAEYKLRKQTLDLIYEVKKAYLDYSHFKEVLDVKMEKFEACRDFYEVMEFEHKEGTISRLTLIDSKMFFHDSIVELRSAVSDYEYAAAKLNILMGRDFDAPLRTVGISEAYLQRIVAPNPHKALFSALLNRPEVFDLASQIEAYRMRLKKEKAGYQPNLDIEGEYNFTQHDDQYDDFEDWNVKFKVSLPILFGQLKTRNKVAMTKAALEITEAQRQQLKERISFEVNRMCSKLNTSRIAVMAAQEKLKLGGDRQNIYQVEEELGELSRKDMTLFNMDYFDIKEDYLDALHSYYLDRITLDNVIASKNTQMLF